MIGAGPTRTQLENGSAGPAKYHTRIEITRAITAYTTVLRPVSESSSGSLHPPSPYSPFRQLILPAIRHSIPTHERTGDVSEVASAQGRR
ncbi:hypothetical protein EVAR_36742_1 [Eumeta japonica]|uniref:Uncharacterized protein n=1 Tax=Eumeta variegata TaxID=151549 RepID=A0A4C1X4A4_EUMVA|nr:hypothetical protein EVAR_36742_1 [Eumeta japonica]